jgi:Uri superfamily endonuclease
MKGSYILLIKLDRDGNIKIGSLGNIFFNKNFYIYIGSGLNGLDSRLKRHLNKTKKIHWHIDFLLEKGKIVDIFYKKGIVKEECKIADCFVDKFQMIPKFGCSDCKCKSHLFFSAKQRILDIIQTLDMQRYDFYEKI